MGENINDGNDWESDAIQNESGLSESDFVMCVNDSSLETLHKLQVEVHHFEALFISGHIASLVHFGAFLHTEFCFLLVFICNLLKDLILTRKA